MNKVKIGQIFSTTGANGVFSPTKSSLFLKRFGNNISNYFIISDEIVIDSTNFLSINQGDNKIVFDDDVLGFTGNGSLRNNELVIGGEDAIISYPIIAQSAGLYYLYVRVLASNISDEISLYLDEDLVGTLSSFSAGSWDWKEISFVIPDTISHNLNIKIEGNNTYLDKIYLATNSDPYLVGDAIGPDLSPSPFLTTHIQVYQLNNSQPTSALLIYDYKNSVNDVVADDWYNYDLSSLNKNDPVVFSGENYAITLSVSGGANDNYIIWDISNTTQLPSLIKVN